MYRLPDLTEIQKDLLLEFYKLSDTIAPTSERYIQLSKRHWDSIAKPLDSLGEFEKIFQKLSAIYESEIPDISNKCITVMCADNGIVKEGMLRVWQSEPQVLQCFVNLLILSLWFLIWELTALIQKYTHLAYLIIN